MKFTVRTISVVIDVLNALNLDTIIPTPFGLFADLLIAILKELEVHYFKCFTKVPPRLIVKIHYWSMQLTPRIVIVFSAVYTLITVLYFVDEKKCREFLETYELVLLSSFSFSFFDKTKINFYIVEEQYFHLVYKILEKNIK